MQLRRYALAACPVLLAAVPQAQQIPVFRAGVELLEVDVSVVDDDGEPITDLSGSDFTVSVDGEPRRIVSAQFIDLRAAATAAREAAAAGAVPGAPPAAPAVSLHRQHRRGPRATHRAGDRPREHFLRGRTTGHGARPRTSSTRSLRTTRWGLSPFRRPGRRWASRRTTGSCARSWRWRSASGAAASGRPARSRAP